MRTLLLLACLCGAVFSWPSFLEDAAGPSMAKKQQDINRLLYRVTEPLAFDELKAIAASFDPVADLSIYADGGAAALRLMSEIKDGRVLQKHHWFSLFNTRQREEALMLFEVLLHCKSWECGVNAAAYFRERMNEGEFVYALYTTVVHSERSKGLVLPALYEITPHMFTNSEIIAKAYTAQMRQQPETFNMHFTGTMKNPEQHVAYFGEDIGLNVHHVTWHMNFPFWWDDAYGFHLDRKGELFFWAHHQLSARFDAERLSNNLGMVEELYWNKPIVQGFAPHTTYRYGGEFPTRPDNIDFSDIEGVIRVRDMMIHESRIRDAIAHGYITAADGSHIDIMNNEGIDHLGDIIESSLYSPNVRYYGALHNEAHIMLGRQSDPKGKFNLPPSVMEHFETATRDPAFFRLHKYMDGIFKEHKDSLPPYTAEEISFPGVHLNGVTIEGKLETFFEKFEFDLKMAVDSSEELPPVDVRATVPRLNHEKFAYNFEVTNDNAAETHAVVRVYLCPRRDNQGIVFSIDEGRWHCIEMDKFWQKLEAGKNHIVRSSSDSSITINDFATYPELIKAADEAVANNADLGMEDHSRSCGIPNRMLLPKGKKEGMEFALVVAVTDGTDDSIRNVLSAYGNRSHGQCGVHGEKYPDPMPMGFPLDRKVRDERIFLNADNIHSSVVKVFHKESTDTDFFH